MRFFTTLIAPAVALTISVVAVAPAATINASDVPPGTIVCRPAKATEKPDATMGTTALVCKPLALIIQQRDGTTTTMGDPKAPPSAAAVCNEKANQQLTTQQQSAVLRECLSQAFSIPNRN